MQINSLEEFVNSIIENRGADLTLYTTSTHKNYAENIINNLVMDNNDYESIAFCFCNYALQKWCIEKRLEVDIDLDSLNEAIKNNDRYFGLKTRNNMFFQKECLTLNDTTVARITEIIEGSSYILNKPELRAIKDIFFGEESSKYIVCNYFEKAIEKIFIIFHEEFNEIALKRDELEKEVSDEIQLAFHNADDLLFVTSRTKNYDISKLNGVNYQTIYNTVKSIINTLDECPFISDLKTVMNRCLNGEKDFVIAQRINRSRNYVQARKELGLKIIESLIWGMFSY